MPSKILIVDGKAERATDLRVKLAAAFYDTVEARSAAEALSIFGQERPDLVIARSPLPDMSGDQFCNSIRTTGKGPDRPILLTLPKTDRAALICGLGSGADQVLCEPFGDALLFAQLRALIRARDHTEDRFLPDDSSQDLGFAEPPPTFLSAFRVAIVAEDRDLARSWQDQLRLSPQYLLASHTPRSLMRDIETRGMPDIAMIGIDARAPAGGLSLVAGCVAQSRRQRSMFLATIGNGDTALAAEALDLGASDLMLNGFDAQEAALRLTRLAQHKQLADRRDRSVRNGLRAALIDPLTGLYNRRHALPQLQRMAEGAARTPDPLAVMIADIDHFKRINDRYGHLVGDDVLRRISERLSAQLPEEALLARIGGEEFLIAVPSISVQAARLTARRLCDAIGSAPIDTPGAAAGIPVTISIGLSLGGGDAQNPPGVSQLMEQADRALYRAKSDGRNQVTVSRPAA